MCPPDWNAPLEGRRLDTPHALDIDFVFELLQPLFVALSFSIARSLVCHA